MKTKEFWEVYSPQGSEVFTDFDKAKSRYEHWVSSNWAKSVDGWTVRLSKVRKETTPLESYTIVGKGVAGW